MAEPLGDTVVSAGGTLLGRFKILRRVGAGGMGEVFEARDLSLGTTVALKTLRRELAGDPGALERLRREVVLARRVTHPNVCRIFEFFESPEVAFLTMEFLEGETLACRLRRSGPLSPEAALPILRDVAAGLEAIHVAGIVHRDVKAGNVILADGGASGARRAVVTDFGIALGGPAERLTGVGGVVGTPDAMAPEQRSGKDVSSRTDVFALALLAGEMLGATDEPGRLPPRWRTALERSLDSDPGRRHPSPEGLVAALEAPRRVPRRGLLLFLAASLLAAVGLGTLVPRLTRTRAADSRSLAVLPFVELGGAASDAWFSEGLTEDILTELGRLPGLQLVSRTSSRAYRNTTKPLRQVADELGVGTVLQGTVRRADGRARISAQLVDARNDRELWAETFDRDARSVLDLQTEVARKVADALKLRLGSAAVERLGTGGTRNADAYEAYLRGLYATDLWEQDRKNLEVAIDAFSRATELDPAYAQAWAQLGYAYARRLFYGGAEPGAQQLDFQHAREALGRAESLAPNLALVHVVRAELLWSQEAGWDADGALASLRSARALDPVAGQTEASNILVHLGLTEQAIREATLAVERDPSSHEAKTELLKGYALAVRYPELLARRPWLSPAPRVEQFLYLALLGTPEGRQELRRANPDPRLAILLDALDGRTEDARRELRAYTVTPEDRRRRYYHHLTFDLAMAHAVLGERDEAVALLRQSAEKGYPNLVAFRDEPRLVNLKGHPGYEALLTELEKKRARWAAEFP
ncbi:MAG TPA: protein kinase [Myxococcaceae bacterium]|nr:protein kinase [Myxococcaceae bacterium]